MIKDLMKIFLMNSKIRIQTNMQYRFDFVNGLFMSLINSSIGVITLFMIFRTTQGYPGWTLTQIFLFQGIVLFWNGVKDMLFGDVRINVDLMVWKGDFDRLLLKPYPPIGMILTSGPNYMSMSGAIAGTIMIITALIQLNIIPGIGALIELFIFLIATIILYMTFLVVYSIILIMLINVGRLREIMDKIMSFSEYPLEIYGKGINWLFRYVVPLSVIAYLPTKMLLGQAQSFSIISIVMCIVLFILSLCLWQRCLNKYTSAGG